MMKNSRIRVLVADDDSNLREVLTSELSRRGFYAEGAENGLKALDSLEKHDYDVLLLDLNMPGLGGIEVLKKIKYLDIVMEVVILTANATVSTAVEAMKLGACDYLTKPFILEELTTVVEKAFEKKRLRSENILLKTQVKMETGRNRMLVTKSPAMTALLESVQKIAVSDLPVLIMGESGVGKEVIARRIHELSTRSDGPFIAINCGAIPENMIESELFGYEKGAFTGAYGRKMGLLEIANNGTLFLDEIGDMPLQLQVKLLRVIETESFFRLGGTRELKVDLRIINATNKDLKAAIEKGTFRHDLFYRLSTLIIQIPPLRERREDIVLLTEHFIHINPYFKGKKFSKKALDVLLSYSWPGNVRELHNVVQRTLLLSKSDVIDCDDLPSDLVGKSVTSGSRLEDMEKNHILRVLKGAGGQRKKAAEALGISQKTLYRKLLSYGVKE